MLTAWKMLPEKSEYENEKKRGRFAYHLALAQSFMLKRSWERAKSRAQAGQERKGQAVLRLVKRWMMCQQCWMQGWREQARVSTRSQQKRCLLNVCHILSDITNSNVVRPLEISRSSRSFGVKKWAVQRLVTNCQQLQQQYLLRWLKVLQCSLSVRLKNEIVVNGFKTLALYVDENVHGRLKSALRTFFRHSKIKKVQINFFNQVFETNIGQKHRAFLIFKSLPDIGLIDQIQNNMKFKRTVKRICNKGKNDTLKQVRAYQQLGNTKKKKCIVLLIKQAMSGYQKAFTLWRWINTNYSNMRKCKSVISTFARLNQKLAEDSLRHVIKTRLLKKKKQSVVRKMIKYAYLKQQAVFRKWAHLNQLFKQRLKQSILAYAQVYRQVTDQRLKLVLKQFSRNSKVISIQHQFFASLLNSSIGQAYTAFTKFRTLPELVNREEVVRRRKFAKQLKDLRLKHVKQAFKSLFRSIDLGWVRKRKVVLILYQKCQSVDKKFIRRWYKLAKLQKQQTACNLLIRMFEQVNDKLRQDFRTGVAEKSRQLRCRRVSAAERLIQLSNAKKSQLFRQWLHKNRSWNSREKKALESLESAILKRLEARSVFSLRQLSLHQHQLSTDDLRQRALALSRGLH